MLPILKKCWREALIFILVIIVMISVRTCHQKALEATQNKTIADSAYVDVQTYKLKDGTNVAQIQTLEATNKDVELAFASMSIDKKVLEEKIGNLNKLVTYYEGKISMDEFLNSPGKDTVIIEVNNGDTVRTMDKVFKWSGKWLTLTEVYYPGVDSLKRRYQYDVEFNIVSYRKGKTLFKPGVLYSDLTFTDPAIKTQKFTAIVIKEEPKKWWETKASAAGIGFLIGLFAGRR